MGAVMDYEAALINGGNRFNYFVIGVPFETKPSWAFWSKTAIPAVTAGVVIWHNWKSVP